MKSEFIECSIGDIVQLKQGLAINAKTKHLLKEKGLPLLRITDLLNNSHEQYVDEEKAPKQCIVNYGDLIYTRTGQVGYIFNNRKGVVHNNCFTIEPTVKDLTKDFIYWYFKQTKIQKYAENIASGSVQKDLNHSAFNSIPFKYPICINTQKKIAHILSTLDNKIELNRKMNQTLEAMAQALFKSWFVNFDPVKAKVNCSSDEELETVAKELGISKEILELFPSEFEDSELGMIPKGWSVEPISKISTVAIGKTPPRKEPQWFTTSNDDIKWISIKDMGNSGTYIIQTNEYLTRDAIKKFNVKLIPINTVLLSFKLTLGRVAITTETMTSNEAIAHFILDNNSLLSTEYIYCYLKNFDYNKLGSTSSIATAINSKIVKTIPIIISLKDIIQEFNKIVKPMFKQIKILTNETQTLQKARDTLLPKLLSGEIEV
jgi:type I restriction enzyme S subunit